MTLHESGWFLGRLGDHWPVIAVGVSWCWSRLRSSMPALGTDRFWRTWAYDFVKGNSATVAAATKPPV